MAAACCLAASFLRRVEALRLAAEWAAMFDSYDAFASAHPGGLYMTSFERLTHPVTRTEALMELLAALGVPPHAQEVVTDPDKAAGSVAVCTSPEQDAQEEASSPDTASRVCTPNDKAADQQGQSLGRRYDPDRIACAFEMAAHPDIYRPKHPDGISGDDAYLGIGVDNVSVDDIGSGDLVCELWRIVGARASAHGYVPYGNRACDSATTHVTVTQCGTA